MSSGVALLVRHGQASFGKADYDRLSAIGHRQARMLGADLARRGLRPTRIVCGSMTRQQETVAGICVGAGWEDLEPHTDPGWNELDHVAVIQAYKPAYRHMMVLKADMVRTLRPRAAFEEMFGQAIRRWAIGEHDADYAETFTAFQQRIDAAFERLVESPAERTLVVSSAGCISQVSARLTSAGSLEAWKEYSLAVANTGVTRISLGDKGPRLLTFNETSHLDGADLATRR